MKKITFGFNGALIFSLLFLGVSRPVFAETKTAYTQTDLQVPYVSQAPLGNWSDARFKDGCEEASVIMAGFWAKSEDVSAANAQKIILDLAAYEKKVWHFHQDTSATDTASLLVHYFGVQPVVRYDITTADIRDALDEGSLVIVPINGTKLGIYGGGVIPRHTVVVTGFDPEANEFTINDPVNGPGIKISGAVLERALRDYPSGIHRAVLSARTAMIVVSKLPAQVAVGN